jgi:hypothetical protein
MVVAEIRVLHQLLLHYLPQLRHSVGAKIRIKRQIIDPIHASHIDTKPKIASVNYHPKESTLILPYQWAQKWGITVEILSAKSTLGFRTYGNNYNLLMNSLNTLKQVCDFSEAFKYNCLGFRLYGYPFELHGIRARERERERERANEEAKGFLKVIIANTLHLFLFL